MATLVVKRGRAKPLWHGHPWVYSQAVERLEGDVSAGDVVDVVDHRGQPIGQATISPGSKIRARILTRDPEARIDADWLRARLRDAIEVRQRFGLPSKQTNCYRLVNSEGDGLPGLVVDVYADAVVVQISTGGMLRLAEQIEQLLVDLLRPSAIVERVAESFANLEAMRPRSRVVRGNSAMVEGHELGLLYQVDLERGQKTGLFLDQRDNRAQVRQLAGGSAVLDLFCYNGGFALNAAAGGAKQVTAVDSSHRAVEAAGANARRNGVEVEFVEADVMQQLRALDPHSFDLVIADPPKFARARKAVPAALQAYERLYAQVCRVLRPGGIVCLSCCSQLINQAELERALTAALGVQHGARLLAARGAGPDHPARPGFPEGAYLKFLVCQLTRS